VVEKAIVQPVLVDGGELAAQAPIEVFDNLGIALHACLRDASDLNDLAALKSARRADKFAAVGGRSAEAFYLAEMSAVTSGCGSAAPSFVVPASCAGQAAQPTWQLSSWACASSARTVSRHRPQR